MNSPALKLGIKPGTRVAIDGMPVENVQGLLGELPEGSRACARDGGVADQLFLVAESLAEVDRMLDGVWLEVAPNGRLWIWYRKGAGKARAMGLRNPLHRDTLQALLAKRGMDGVTLIAVDDVWSAMRVREL